MASAGKRGATVIAACSVSDAPPTVLVCLNRENPKNEAFVENGNFALNTLGSDQQPLAVGFSGITGLPVEERFALAEWDTISTGAPTLVGALAVFDCEMIDTKDHGHPSCAFWQGDRPAHRRYASPADLFQPRLSRPLSRGRMHGDQMTELKPRPVPQTIDETLELLTGADYVADRSLATVLFLALRMKRPLFLEGEAGVGKTEIAKVLAQALGRRLIRLQCYEGLDVSSAVYEWNYAAQMIEIRMEEAAGERRPRRDMETQRLLRKIPDPPAGARGADRRGGRRARSS